MGDEIQFTTDTLRLTEYESTCRETAANVPKILEHVKVRRSLELGRSFRNVYSIVILLSFYGLGEPEGLCTENVQI